MATTTSSGQDAAAAAGWDAERVNDAAPENNLDRLADAVLSRILSRAGTRTVFGEPVTQGDVTVIPVAKVSTRFGFGGGSGRDHATFDKPGTYGGGMGGGGDVRAKPLGYIEITATGSQFYPIEDGMEIGLVAMKCIGIAIVLVALRFLLRGVGRRKEQSRLAQPLEAVGELVDKKQRRKAKRRAARMVQAVPWDTLASVASAAAKARQRAA
jgi:uncharacterized spore protein YtfJ